MSTVECPACGQVVSTSDDSGHTWIVTHVETRTPVRRRGMTPISTRICEGSGKPIKTT